MKKIFLKSMIAVAVVGVAVAISSVATFAATVHQFNYTTLEYGENNSALATGAIDSYFEFSGKTALKLKSEEKNGVQKVLGVELSKSGSTVMTFNPESDGVARVWLGSTGSSNSSAVTILDTTTNDSVLNKVTISGTVTSRDANEYSFDVTGGHTYTMVESSGDRGLRLYAITVVEGDLEQGLNITPSGAVYVSDNDVYLIAGVSEEKVTDISVDSVNIRIGKTATTSDTVYKSLSDGNVSVTAEEIGADYLYAVKLSNANADAKTATFTYSTTAVTTK